MIESGLDQLFYYLTCRAYVRYVTYAIFPVQDYQHLDAQFFAMEAICPGRSNTRAQSSLCLRNVPRNAVDTRPSLLCVLTSHFKRIARHTQSPTI